MDVESHEAHNGLEVVTESPRSLDAIKRKKAKGLGSSKSGVRSEMKATKRISLDKKIKPKITCKDQNVHQSVLLGLPENSELFYKFNGETLLTGRKQGHGIFCNCCNTEVSASKFEAHAGKASRRKPYHNIFDSNGVSLHTYATERIENRCIQIVDKPAGCDLVACVLCKAYDFIENGFDDRTAIICNQCEREYHVGCLRESKIADLKELPLGKWFCSADCMRLHNVKLIFIRCKDASEENRLLLDEAVKIFHASDPGCFNSITDLFIGSTLRNINNQLKSCYSQDVPCSWATNCRATTCCYQYRSYQGKGYLQLSFKCFEEFHLIKVGKSNGGYKRHVDR